VVLVVILSMVAAVAVPHVRTGLEEAKRSACAQNVARINALIERWYAEKGRWPEKDLYKELGGDPGYLPRGLPVCPVDGSRYELDPTTHRVKPHNHWPPLHPDATGEQHERGRRQG
jgi:hypothetical protein